MVRQVAKILELNLMPKYIYIYKRRKKNILMEDIREL